MDDYQFDKQFKNMGIDTDAVKNTQVKGSTIQVIDVSDNEGEKPEAQNADEEQKEEAPKPTSSVSDDALEAVKQSIQRSQSSTDARIENLKAEINKVLGQFHEQIQTLTNQVKDLKSRPAQQAPAPQQNQEQSSQEQQSQPQAQQERTPDRNGFAPGDKEVSVENIFNFSNATDFKRS